MPGRHSEFPSTDFAITSVNVGDRLDQREIEDRKQQEEWSFYARRHWGSAVRMWARRLLPYIVLLALLGFAGSWLAEERDALGAGRIAQHLTSALRVPVQVRDTRFRTTPAPALVLTGVDLGGQVHLDEVTLEFTAPSLWQAVISGRRRWGDIVVSPVTLTFDQANQLLVWLKALDSAVPDSVTRVRIREVRFSRSGLLPDRYEAVTRREANGQFASVTLRRLDSPGTMQLRITPDPAGGPIAFECDGSDWQPPFAPHTAWSEMVANGHISGSSIDLDKFTLGSGFGAIEGHLSVHRHVQGGSAWAADGQISSVGIDVPTLILQITKPGKAPSDADEATQTPIAGTASIEAALEGTGATPEDALSQLVAVGEVNVRGASLNGINLGYAASRPSPNSPNSTASTRFIHLNASFAASSAGALFRNVHGTAGALSTRGEITVSPALAVDGVLHVDLGGSRVQAPLRLHVRGDVAHPVYGR